MLNFRPRGKQASTYSSSNDKWRLFAMIVASLMLLVLILRLGSPPADRSLPPAESQRQAVEYNATTMFIACVTAIAAVAAITAVAFLSYRGRRARRRPPKSPISESRPDSTAMKHT